MNLCGANQCVFGRPEGPGTNGGCQCMENVKDERSLGPKTRAVILEIRRLIEDLDRARGDISMLNIQKTSLQLDVAALRSALRSNCKHRDIDERGGCRACGEIMVNRSETHLTEESGNNGEHSN